MTILLLLCQRRASKIRRMTGLSPWSVSLLDRVRERKEDYLSPLVRQHAMCMEYLTLMENMQTDRSKLSKRGTFAFQPVFYSSCNAIVWPFNIIPDY